MTACRYPDVQGRTGFGYGCRCPRCLADRAAARVERKARLALSAPAPRRATTPPARTLPADVRSYGPIHDDRIARAADAMFTTVDDHRRHGRTAP